MVFEHGVFRNFAVLDAQVLCRELGMLCFPNVFLLFWDCNLVRSLSIAESNRPLLLARGGIALLDRMMELHYSNDAVLRRAREARRLAQLQ